VPRCTQGPRLPVNPTFTGLGWKCSYCSWDSYTCILVHCYTLLLFYSGCLGAAAFASYSALRLALCLASPV
jgi:hypothetical protein